MAKNINDLITYKLHSVVSIPNEVITPEKLQQKKQAIKNDILNISEKIKKSGGNTPQSEQMLHDIKHLTEHLEVRTNGQNPKLELLRARRIATVEYVISNAQDEPVYKFSIVFRRVNGPNFAIYEFKPGTTEMIQIKRPIRDQIALREKLLSSLLVIERMKIFRILEESISIGLKEYGEDIESTLDKNSNEYKLEQLYLDRDKTNFKIFMHENTAKYGNFVA